MKYLNLSRLFIFFFLLASCHSTEVVLRKSKAQGITDYSQKPENNDTIHTNISQEAVKHELSKITLLQEIKTTLQNQNIRTEDKQDYTHVTPNISKQHNPNNASSNQRIQHQTTHNTPNASAKKIYKQQSYGFFWWYRPIFWSGRLGVHIGRSCSLYIRRAYYKYLRSHFSCLWDCFSFNLVGFSYYTSAI